MSMSSDRMRAVLVARELLASGARHVRTPAGAKKYDQPIGSVIVPDVIPHMETPRATKAVVTTPLEPHGTMEVKKEGATTMTTSASDSRVAAQVMTLTTAQKIVLKALTELAPKATSNGVTVADISQHLYGKRTAASSVQAALNDPVIQKNFVDMKRLPQTGMRQHRVLYTTRRSARQAAAAGLLDSGKTDAPNPEPAEVVQVKDAQPEAKSPRVQAAEKKALAVKTDTRLAEIYNKSWVLKEQMAGTAQAIHLYSGSPVTSQKYATKKTYGRSVEEAMTDFQGKEWDRTNWERQVAQYQQQQTALDALNKESAELNAIYQENGWTRAFLVTNQGGHVHRSMSCSTCYPTTKFHWLPEYSGSDEDQIVEDAGERACTICYPSAPVDTLKRATKIFSEDEKAQAIARQERAAAKVARESAKNAKAISNPDGTDLWVMDAYDIDRSKQPRARYSRTRYGEHLRTEAAARQWYVRHEADYMVMKATPEYRYGSAYNPEAQEQILLALAAKHSTTVEEIRAELAAKAKAKANQQLRELGRPKIA